MNDNTIAPVGHEIFRLLDGAFAGVEMTLEAQDLREEVRANLVARAAELEASGQSTQDAARQAISELGDVRDLLDVTATSANAPEGWDAAAQHHRVRPKPGFVVGVVVAALAAFIGLLLATLAATGVLPLPTGPIIALVGIGATGIAWIVGDSLAHETTTNHPMPTLRASGYFLASLLAVYGLGFGGLVTLGALPAWAIVFAALGVVAAIVLFAFLAATQTNRRKAWVIALRRDQPTKPNR